MRCIDADVLEKEGWSLHRTVRVDKHTTEYQVKPIAKVPTIEPERKKGKWQITEAYPHNVYCSECHKRYAQTHWEVWKDGSLPRKYCPNCGADMMEGEQDGQT